MAELLLRYAHSDDLADLLFLYQQLSPASPVLAADSASATWQTMLTDPRMHILVAEQGGSGGGLVGTVTLSVIPNLTQGARPYALIDNVVTREDARGQGTGKALMAKAIEVARNLNAYKVMLLTGRRAPEVHRLYAGSGLRSDATAYFARLGSSDSLPTASPRLPPSIPPATETVE